MARKVAYILLTKSGQSREAQLAAIQAAGVPLDPVYDDDLRKRRALERREFPQRKWMLHQLRPGDTVAVASPGRLGLDKEDVLATMAAIETKDCSILDASTGVEFRWTPEIAAAATFAERAISEHRTLRAAAARRAKADAGIKGGRPPVPLLVSEAEAKRMWHNQADYPSQKAVAALIGRAARTCYKLWGPRGGVPHLKRRRA